MPTAPLGGTGMAITRVGFGAWAIGGGGWDWAWGGQDDAESEAAIHRALELGVNWIDTAAQYGFGHSEVVVGRALDGVSPRPWVFTRCGQPEGPGRTTTRSLRRDSIRREVEGSLRRLRADAVDVRQIHFPDPDAELEEGWATLAELKAEGVARHIGASNVDVARPRRAQAIAPVETLQPPYSLIARDAEAEIPPDAEREGIGVVVCSPMGSGMLTGRMTRERIAALPDDDCRRRGPRFREPQLTGHLALVDRLAAAAARHGVTPGAVAVAWTLHHPAVDGAIAGFRGPGQVDAVVAAAGLALDDGDLAAIAGAPPGRPPR